MKRMFEYECKIHGVFEALVEQENRHIPRPCFDCGDESPNIISTPQIALEGVSGDFPTASEKWANAHERGAKQQSHWLGE